MAIDAEDPRNPLERRCPNLHRLDRRTERAAPVEEGIERRGGKRLAQDLEALLASPHACEPVVYECDAKAGKLRWIVELIIGPPVRRHAPVGTRNPFSTSRTQRVPIAADAGVHVSLLRELDRQNHLIPPGQLRRATLASISPPAI